MPHTECVCASHPCYVHMRVCLYASQNYPLKIHLYDFIDLSPCWQRYLLWLFSHSVGRKPEAMCLLLRLTIYARIHTKRLAIMEGIWIRFLCITILISNV